MTPPRSAAPQDKPHKRKYRSALMQRVYDGFRRSPPRYARTGTGFAYHYGFNHPDETPPRSPMIQRHSQAWAAWAAGVDNARFGTGRAPASANPDKTEDGDE